MFFSLLIKSLLCPFIYIYIHTLHCHYLILYHHTTNSITKMTLFKHLALKVHFKGFVTGPKNTSM